MNDDKTASDESIGRTTRGLSRRRMLKGTSAALVALGFLETAEAGNFAQTSGQERTAKQPPRTKPGIVLVHGAFADGTGWQHVIRRLQKDGYSVTAVQNALTSLDDDVATTKRVIDTEATKGPIIVVGHSYGGAVITAAANGNVNVKALVYLAAFAPEAGEPVGAFLGQYPSLLGTGLVPDAAGFLYIDRSQFREIFAKDVDRNEVGVMAVAQKPILGHIFGESSAVAAWHSIPSWYLVSTQDNAINPELQRFYATRMGATTSEIASSHVAFISRPGEVTKLIETVASVVT